MEHGGGHGKQRPYLNVGWDSNATRPNFNVVDNGANDMNYSPYKQSVFAMPAMFIAVAIAFMASLNVKGKDGTTVAEAMGMDTGKQAEFAAVERHEESDPFWVDE